MRYDLNWSFAVRMISAPRTHNEIQLLACRTGLFATSQGSWFKGRRQSQGSGGCGCAARRSILQAVA